MADVDEDEIPRAKGSIAPDADLDDETQDFRFLQQLSKTSQTIPKRGEKDFEPHHTSLQTSTLEASRAAMHAALSVPRIHVPKNRLSAVYSPSPNGAWVEHAKGPYFKTIGQSRKGRTWLNPEEALYLIERGSLDVRWPDVETTVNESVITEEGPPMSVQGAYAAFIGMEHDGPGALTLDRYVIYAGLKRNGYAVYRAEGWDGTVQVWNEGQKGNTSERSKGGNTWGMGLFGDLWTRTFSQDGPASLEEAAQGPLVPPGLYRSYANIYRRLDIIPRHNPRASKLETSCPNPLTITFNVHKPTPQFRKSSPGSPDFRIAVVSARDTSVPTLAQLHSLLAATPMDPAPAESSLYHKLKHGYRNAVLAIVDQGITSYIRVADAAFGEQKIYQRIGRGSASKRGGRGKKARGQGRG